MDRKRERALASIPNFRDGDDVEEFSSWLREG